MNPGPPVCLRGVLLLAGMLLTALPLRAQSETVPRTRTFSGLVSPAFPYALPEDVGLSSKTLDWLGDEIVTWVASGELVGAELLVVKDGKAVFHEAYGWSDREEKEPVERNSIWSIKSMSKPFTATAVLMLVEEGKLSLDDPVSRYVADFAHDAITIHHLLSHTSGFIHDGDWYDHTSPEASLQEWVEEWRHRAPEKPLGVYDYADFNYAHLGYIVGKVSRISIDDFTEERIIRPLDLEDTSTGFSMDPAWRARLNPWYRWNERARAYDLRWTSGWPGWTTYPAAWGMFSTAMDYAVFMAMWMNDGEWKGKRLLSKEMVNEALQPQGRISGSWAYGYGWLLDDLEGVATRPFGHGGGDGAQALAFPADDAIVIFMAHSRWGPHDAAFWHRLGLSGLFEHHPGYGIDGLMVWASERDFAERELRPEERARYSGTYLPERRGQGAPQSLGVWEESDRLHVRLGRYGSRADQRFHLVPLGNDRFALGRYGDGRLRAVDPSHEVRFILVEGVAITVEVTESDRVLFSGQRTATGPDHRTRER